jgi:hypothetical protein
MGTEKKKLVGVRLDPEVYRAMYAHLSDPLYLNLPKGAVETFINLAIRRELLARGIECNYSESSSSTTTPGTPPVEFF